MKIANQISIKRSIWNFCLVHVIGFLITLSAIVLMVLICIAVFRNGNSFSDDLNGDFVYGIFAAYWWRWIAENRS